MPQTQDVGDFMSVLGSFYEIVEEESPMKTASVPNGVPLDDGYNTEPSTDTSTEHGNCHIYLFFLNILKFIYTLKILFACFVYGLNLFIIFILLPVGLSKFTFHFPLSWSRSVFYLKKKKLQSQVRIVSLQKSRNSL